MLKKILVVIDESSASQAAKLYAIELAKTMKCELTGLGIIDTPWITAAQPEPLGGGAYKIYRDKEVISSTHKKVKQMLKNFDEMCKQSNIESHAIEQEGFPATEIEVLSEEHDLIIIGSKTDFHFELDEDSDLTVRHITRDNPRPVLAVTSPDLKVMSNDTVLIAYDGSLQAARSLHMFLLLGLGQGKKLHVVSVAKTHKEAEQIAKRAQRMCQSHGYDAVAQGVGSSKSVETVLKDKLAEIKPCMLVMGAYSHSSIKDFIFGSKTEHMIKESKTPVFIHH